MEPNGWAAVNLPANFIATADEHTRSGELLGFAVNVHFIPVGFTFTYGDGTELRPSSGGSTWNTANLPEFSTTETSHVYTESGTYMATVAVTYEAEYQLAGSDWLTVDGSLQIDTTTPITVTAKSAKTVLVDRACTDRRAGPGC